MLGKRYIAIVPQVSIVRDADGVGIVQRDEDGRPIVSHYNLHHNAKLYEEAGRARREANAYSRNEGHGRVLAVDLDELPLVDETAEQREQRLDRQLLHAAGELAVLRGLTGVDKGDRDYHVRAKRTHELREKSAVQVREMLEAFKPPHYVIETRRNVGHGANPCSACGVTWFGRELDGLMASSGSWLAYLKDPRPDGSDAHIFTISRTEAGALAKLLAVIIDGGGFFPMT